MYPDKIEFKSEQSISTLVSETNPIRLRLESSEDSIMIDQRVDHQLTLCSTQSTNRLEIKQDINEFVIISPKFNHSPTITIDNPDETRIFTTSQDIEQYNCVSIDIDNYTVSKTSLEPNNSRKYLGIALETVDVGLPIKVKISGIIFDPNWDWDTNYELWCREDASLTQQPHNITGLMSLKVAEVLTKNMIVVSRFEPILL